VKKNIADLAEELALILKQHPRKFFSPGNLADRLHTDLTILEKSIRELKSWGYKIACKRSRGIRLEAFPDLFLPLEIKYGLKTRILGKKLYCFQSLGSTNQVAFHLAESGDPEGTLVLAEKQTAGRGRLSRQWFSPPRLGIWLSLILRPRIPLAWVPALSLCACLACVRATNHFTNRKAAVKWPNDAYLNGKKFSGVLTELSAELDRVNFVVLGIGINVNHSSTEFPGSLRKDATSLRIETKRKIDRVSLLHKFLEEFEKIYQEYQYSGLKKFKPEVLKSFYLLNKEIEVEIGDKKILGKAIGTDDYGALILETKSGLKTITAGDVALV